MPDNVQLAQGPLVVASIGDAANVQHQEVINEYLSSGNVPINVGVNSPLPVADNPQLDLLMALLAEMRLMNHLLYYGLTYPEVDDLEGLREQYRGWPV